MLEWLGAFVGGLELAAEDHGDAAIDVELDDHVGTFVRDQMLFVLTMRRNARGPGVEIVADLAMNLPSANWRSCAALAP